VTSDLTEPTLVRGRTIVVTGGTGTFGGAAVERFLAHGAKEIRILSRDEKKQDDMRRQLSGKPLRFFIGDVRDRPSLSEVMYGADFVFHAAALKQVPSCEHFPLEAVKTNIFGTENVLDAAVTSGVKCVVVLSTDKAAYPINAMGMAKALMEKVTYAKAPAAAKRGTILCATRYGNVLASRGSVVPVFLEQAAAGRPLTVTDPEMTRFVMCIDDALDLIEFAIAHASPGDLFVHRAPAVRLGILAEAVRSLFNKGVVNVVGRREGEKSAETLLTREEMARAVVSGDFFRVPAEHGEGAPPHALVAPSENVVQPRWRSEITTNGDAFKRPATVEAYTSESARLLDIPEMTRLLRENEIVRMALAGTPG
jgi:UDP-glucose 4-epimerase